MDFKKYLAEATEEKYFLAADGEVHENARIYFTKESAFGQKVFEYIDSFDPKGTHVKAYKLVDGEYTEDF